MNVSSEEVKVKQAVVQVNQVKLWMATGGTGCEGLEVRQEGDDG